MDMSKGKVEEKLEMSTVRFFQDNSTEEIFPSWSVSSCFDLLEFVRGGVGGSSSWLARSHLSRRRSSKSCWFKISQGLERTDRKCKQFKWSDLPSCYTRSLRRIGRNSFNRISRYDFVAPSTFFYEKKPWMDRLRCCTSWHLTSSFAKIFKAIRSSNNRFATRLKGLTTGGLPTFIDVGNDFWRTGYH
ncbi:hypothetical protein H5410_050358 [Solanum commersonii]|uniref:Uncharacterized protein n=1 Tax=Solanum commersonii TaxID=4109 RepID=A0A9J5WV88_SOLCO|nr:hypothetical protein H5410_050358 [Solanum commersonii]